MCDCRSPPLNERINRVTTAFSISRNFTRISRFFSFSVKMKKRRKPLILLKFSGGVFGVPEVIRTPDLPLRRRSLYPAELRKHFENLLLLYNVIVILSTGVTTEFYHCPDCDRFPPGIGQADLPRSCVNAPLLVRPIRCCHRPSAMSDFPFPTPDAYYV